MHISTCIHNILAIVTSPPMEKRKLCRSRGFFYFTINMKMHIILHEKYLMWV